MSASEHADFTPQERDRLEQELLELHFGCHEDPAALEARLAAEPALRALQAVVLRKADVLRRAAQPATPRLDVRVPRPWYRRPALRIGLAAGIAALAVVVPLTRWGYHAWRERSVAQAEMRVTVSAPRTVPAGAPWSFTVQSEDLAGTAKECTVRYHALAGDGTELARAERASTGNLTIELPANLQVPQRLVVEAVRGERTVRHELTLTTGAATPLVHVTTDKPVYRPGERVFVRAVALDRLTLARPPQIAMGIKVKDPKGAVVFEDGDVNLGGEANGDEVGACVWSVPAASAGGEHTLEVTSNDGTFPPERTTFVVRSYQPPRLAKTLVLDRKTYLPGQSGAAEVRVERMGGGVAAGAVVRAALVLDGAEVWTADATLDATGRSVFRFVVPREVRQGAARFLARIEDGGVVETEMKPFVVPTGKVAVACFPEGGELVAGVENRVYLEATDPLGRPVDTQGTVHDARGDVVATFRTEHQGRTRVVFTPRLGNRYAVRTVATAPRDEFAMPEVRAEGIVLRALGESATGPVRVRVAGRGEGPWLVGVFGRGALLAQQALRPDGQGEIHADVELPLPAAAGGVLRVTVFDRTLRPLAERLVQRDTEGRVQVTFTAEHPVLTPGAKQRVRVRTTDEHGVPIAAVVGAHVTDRATVSMGLEPRVGLQDHGLLFADVERTEDLGDFFLGVEHRARNVDLLLGTRGWRRFVWQGGLEAQVAAHGERARELLAHEGYAASPQVASNQREASAMVATLAQAARQDRRTAGEVAALALCVLVLLLLAEGAAMVGGRWLRWPLPGQAALATGAVAALMVSLMVMLQGGLRDHMPAPAFAFAEFAGVDGAGGDEFFIGGAKLYDVFRAAIHDADVMPDDEEKLAPVLAEVEDAPVAAPAEVGLVVEARVQPERELAVWRAQRVREYAYVRRSDGRAGDAARADFTETVYWNPLLATGADGSAQFEFEVSDSVTTWLVRADAHGVGASAGRIGQAEAAFDSRLPFHLETKLPTEVSADDRLLLPVAVTRTDGDGDSAELAVHTTGALALRGAAEQHVALVDGRGRALVSVLVGETAGDATLRLEGTAGRFRDRVAQRITIAPRGFPHVRSFGGTVAAGAPGRLVVPMPQRANPGSGRLTLKLYPSPLATMRDGLQGMLREPTGCFEQASSSNYPNTMVLSYLEASGDDVPAVAARARELLPPGYARIAGYECKEKGYEWFGGDPGHEALTAYGLLQFRDMSRVHDVDAAMVARTRAWLLDRRDGKGSFRTNERALDSFGRAPQSVTDPYLVYALLASGSEAGELRLELDTLAARVPSTGDAYELAVIANALDAGARPEVGVARARLRDMQTAAGSLRGSTTSITSSGGDDLAVETTAFAVLAWLPDSTYAASVRSAVEWLRGQQSARGTFGATQATIMGLKALTAYATHARTMRAPGVVQVFVGGKPVAREAFPAGHPDALVFELWGVAGSGDAEIRVELEGGGGVLPWACDLGYHTDQPADDPDAKVAIATRLAQDSVEEGRTVSVHVAVQNQTDTGLPMTMAIVGIPAGLEVPTAELADRQRSGAFDLWELRGRELILYWRGLAPNAVRSVDLDCVARIPGVTAGPASRTYLYYTPSDVRWAPPLRVEVTPLR